MEAISVDGEYFNEVYAIRVAGAGVAGIRDGISPDGTLIVENTIGGNGFYSLYQKLSDALDQYGDLVLRDITSFNNTGTNQEAQDAAYGGQ